MAPPRHPEKKEKKIKPLQLRKWKRGPVTWNIGDNIMSSFSAVCLCHFQVPVLFCSAELFGAELFGAELFRAPSFLLW